MVKSSGGLRFLSLFILEFKFFGFRSNFRIKIGFLLDNTAIFLLPFSTLKGSFKVNSLLDFRIFRFRLREIGI